LKRKNSRRMYVCYNYFDFRLVCTLPKNRVRSGWDLNCSCSMLLYEKIERENADLLRSWVQIPPGPLFTVLEIRYCSEIDFDDRPTETLAMPMPYPTVCPTKVEIFLPDLTTECWSGIYKFSLKG
jgi:hypothetical protein